MIFIHYIQNFPGYKLLLCGLIFGRSKAGATYTVEPPKTDPPRSGQTARPNRSYVAYITYIYTIIIGSFGQRPIQCSENVAIGFKTAYFVEKTQH